MKIPDLISPIIGHRVWRWDATGLRSLNGKPWSPRQPLAAKCGAGNAHDAHEPPHLDCTCGVYAAKNLEHLRQLGYEGRGIRGEVHLWGTVVEHEVGYRSEFAYPKTLFLPPDLIPSDTKEMEARMGALAAYDIDIFIGGGQKIPLCRKGSGFDGAGLDYLIGKRTEYYDRRQRDRTLMRGDRVAVLGRGIAVVEHADDTEVQALLRNRIMVRIARREIRWIGGTCAGRRKSWLQTASNWHTDPVTGVLSVIADCNSYCGREWRFAILSPSLRECKLTA